MTSLLDRIFWRRRCRAFLKPFVNESAALVVGAPPVNPLIPLHQLHTIELARPDTSGYWSIDLVYHAVELDLDQNIIAANSVEAFWKLVHAWEDLMYIEPAQKYERWRFLLKDHQLEVYKALHGLMQP